VPFDGLAGVPRARSFAAGEMRMAVLLWMILVIVLVIWLIGWIAGLLGGLIHILLIVALAILIFNLLAGRRRL
jgi:hypothetical protein